MIGNVDSGKSSIVGVLTRNMLDDGRGKARSLVFRHRHEAENGRTSSVATEVMVSFGQCFQSSSTRTSIRQPMQSVGSSILKRMDACTL